MAKKLALKSFRLKKFKAIEDSGVVKFTPLTVLIGDNGSGKSSLVEGLRTYQTIVIGGLDEALGMWRGFEYIVNPPLEIDERSRKTGQVVNPIEFVLHGQVGNGSYRTAMKVNLALNNERAEFEQLDQKDGGNTDNVCIEWETIQEGNRRVLERDRHGRVRFKSMPESSVSVPAHMSVMGPWWAVTDSFADSEVRIARDEKIEIFSGFHWQFVTLDPYAMGDPRPLQRSDRRTRLNIDGSSVAEYLLDIRKQDQDAYDGIVEAMQYVLPFMTDLKIRLTSELERSVYLELAEGERKIPGWLLSTGTLRILALLALFRHPDPPPLIVIEEIENGLDPRSVGLIVEEIRRVTESGRSQVILTSHSPYLLDLFDLSHIVLVERIDGTPTFTRPDDREDLNGWKERFGPGRLLASGRLRSRELA